MSKEVLFSGIQPTGNLHIGNYLGAVKNWVKQQNSGKYNCYFCVADYHSLTGNMGPFERHKQILHTAAELLALGIDPDKSTFFIQSDVVEHTELAWIFNTVTPISELQRMTQFKDKSENQEKNVNAGLFTYPVLQAADILLYHGTVVPVGQDQVQHVELTRDIARWFNNKYEKYFPETKVLLTEISKVMSLLEPTKKMSKSLGQNHVIELADHPDMIEKKLKKAVTDSGEGKSPAAENLFLLLKNFAKKDIYNEFAAAQKQRALQYGDLKKTLAEAITMYFEEFREKREALLSEPKKLEELLNVGAKKAKTAAKKNHERCKKIDWVEINVRFNKKV